MFRVLCFSVPTVLRTHALPAAEQFGVRTGAAALLTVRLAQAQVVGLAGLARLTTGDQLTLVLMRSSAGGACALSLSAVRTAHTSALRSAAPLPRADEHHRPALLQHVRVRGGAGAQGGGGTAHRPTGADLVLGAARARPHVRPLQALLAAEDEVQRAHALARGPLADGARGAELAVVAGEACKVQHSLYN